MSLPKSVQAQAEAARKHFEKPTENPEELPTEGQPPAPEGDDRNPPPADPAPDEPKPKEEAQSAQSSEPAREDRDAAYWEHRFNVVRGKYDKELPALRQENAKLKQQVAEKDQRITELEAKPQGGDNSGVSDDQLAQFKASFGEDLVDFVSRMVQQNAPAPQADTGNTRELQERLDRLEADKQEDAEARFWVALEQAVPTFRQVNADPGFHQFLAQLDPQTGKPRQQALTEAQQALNAAGVADIFRAYLSQSAQPPAPKVPEESVEPRTTRATSAPEGKKVWSRAEISQFYRDKTAGRVKADEAERLEADIFAAQQEGRVR